MRCAAEVNNIILQTRFWENYDNQTIYAYLLNETRVELSRLELDQVDSRIAPFILSSNEVDQENDRRQGVCGIALDYTMTCWKNMHRLIETSDGNHHIIADILSIVNDPAKPTVEIHGRSLRVNYRALDVQGVPMRLPYSDGSKYLALDVTRQALAAKCADWEARWEMLLTLDVNPVERVLHLFSTNGQNSAVSMANVTFDN